LKVKFLILIVIFQLSVKEEKHSDKV